MFATQSSAVQLELFPKSNVVSIASPVPGILEPTDVQLYEHMVQGNVGQPGFGQMYSLQNIHYFPATQMVLPFGEPWGPGWLTIH